MIRTHQSTTAIRKLIITDEGTHSGPRYTRVYRVADGRFQTVVRVGNGLVSDRITDDCPKTSELATAGRWRHCR